MPRPKKLEERFARFHEANPEVYELFEAFALEMIAAGQTKFGAPVLWERIRWETFIDTDGCPYKLPNECRALYARMFRDRNPDLAHHIRIKRRRGE